MSKDKLDIPFILPPPRIYNYAQAISSLKHIRARYDPLVVSSKYIDEVIPLHTLEQRIKSLGSFMSHKRSIFSVSKIINGYLQKNLNEKLMVFTTQVIENSNKLIKQKLNEIKDEKRRKVLVERKIKEQSIYRFDKNEPVEFSNPAISNIYDFLVNDHPPSSVALSHFNEIGYLESQYFNYIERFIRENALLIKNTPHTNEEKIKEFVKLRYNKTGYGLEVYEESYVFAELYTMLRCGLTGSIYTALEKYNTFLSYVTPGLKEALISWIDGKRVKYSEPVVKGDKFKIFLHQIVTACGDIQPDELVICTIEDFIWYQMINITEEYTSDRIINLFQGFKNHIGLLLVTILCKKYDKAIEVVYENEFDIVESYFLIRELVKKSGKKFDYLLDVVFTLCVNLKNVNNKIKIIEDLKSVIGDSEIFSSMVADRIVKHKCYDVLSIHSSLREGDLCDRIACILKLKNDSAQLLKLYYLFKNEDLILEVLNNSMMQSIFDNSSIFPYNDVVDYYRSRTCSRNTSKMNILAGLLIFKQKRDINSLRDTIIFNSERMDLGLIEELKPGIERVMMWGSEIIKRVGDKNLAREMFKKCGQWNLSVECCSMVDENLILLI
ncbi:hypothetical protein TCON_1452 [Astathelohania contejeani]|uniref:Nuclear pore protein n=1 Tax=Astathelohania contejeani TaxID=164912 RepID=A0ABQ7HYS5_9MICR|nr:hypothetical protein TCON_1452 [Thelohania contejeani]